MLVYLYLSDCTGADIIEQFSEDNNGSGKAWQCKDSKECIDYDNVCDNETQCVDGSDEMECCK